MKSFMYLVELILVAVLLISYLYYVRNPEIITKIVSQFEKKYLLDTLSASTLNIYKYDIEDLFKLYYMLYAEKLKDFSQNIEKIDIIDIEIDKLDCLMFMYPFPNIDEDSYFSQEYINFNILNIDGEICKNISVSNDWKIIKISSITNPTISLEVGKLLNLSRLDPYSLFVFDKIGNEIKIDNLSYDDLYLNLSIKFNSTINFFPIYVLLRVKESENMGNLNYLSGRYQILSSLQASAIQNLSIEKNNWLTIYLYDSCSLKEPLVIYYSIPPSSKFRSMVSKDVNKLSCNGSYNIIYFSNNFFENYNKNALRSLKVYAEPILTAYENSIYLINGLNLAILNIYGS